MVHACACSVISERGGARSKRLRWRHGLDETPARLIVHQDRRPRPALDGRGAHRPLRRPAARPIGDAMPANATLP